MDFSRLRASTVPGLLVERARSRPDRVAFRAKELGVYRETTWAGLAARVATVADGLATRFGVGRGTTVAIVGDPCPEWTIADLAAQALGAVSYGIYPTSAPGEVRYLLEHGGARVVVVEDQEHLDKTLAVLDDCPGVRGVIVVDTRALFMYRSARVHRFADLEAAGSGAPSVDALARLAAGVRPDDPATIVYTSGTTGHPKGVLYRHGQHLAACANILAHYPVLTDGEHRVVAMLPLCHTMGRNTVITMPLLADIVPHYPESLDTFAQSLYEVAPTFVFTVPRYLQKFAAHLLVGIDASSPLKRAAYRAALRLGRRGAAGMLARALVFRWLLEKVGLARVRLAISSGAPLPPAVARLWQAWGVNLCEAYGQTETGGALVSGQRGPYPRPGDVGTPAPNIEVTLGDDGELLVRGADLFAGYWRDTEATAAACRDGWLRTGDVAERTPEGAIRLVDRQKDLVITAGGKNVSPAQIETAMRASPYVSDAVVFGEGRRYLAALIEMDGETVAEWARGRGLTHTGYASLAALPEVRHLLEGEIAQANASLGRVEQVKAFRVLPRELDPEQEGEPVTPTRKVKRRLMLERYRDLIESMFASDEERRITAEVAALTQERRPDMRGRILGAVAAVLVLITAPHAPAQAPEPYRIGMTAAITGPFSTGYAPTYEAYRTYVKRINDAGGIHGHPVAISYEDDRGEPQRAAAAAKKLTDGALLLINASISPTYKPVMTEAEASKTPLLFGGGVCPREAFPPAAPLIFCTTSFGSKWDSRMALGFIKEQSAGRKVKVGFAAQDIPLSRIELEFAEQHAKELGMDTIPVVVVPGAASDFTPFAQNLKDAGADWVFSWAPWGVEIGVFEALNRIGWKGNYILYGHQPAQDELTRLKAPNLHALTGNAMFIENLPIHAEIATLVKGQTNHPAHYMAEGWTSAMVLEAGLRACGWPCSREKLAQALSRVSVDTKGLRGGPIEMTADNHYRKTTYYKVYRWDAGKGAIVSVGGWSKLDIK